MKRAAHESGSRTLKAVKHRGYLGPQGKAQLPRSGILVVLSYKDANLAWKMVGRAGLGWVLH